MVKKQICDQLKGPDSRRNKKHECSLGYKSFSWVEAVSYWWRNIIAGSLYQKKKILPYYCNLFFSFLKCRGLWRGYVTKQVLYMANSEYIHSEYIYSIYIFYTQEYKVASYKRGQVASPEDEKQGNKSTLSQCLLPTISALTCDRAYRF